MNSSVISWISRQSPLSLYPDIQCHQSTTVPAMENSMLMDQGDFMDPFNEDLASVFGQDIRTYLSSASNSVVSSSTVISNIPGIEQVRQHMAPGDYSKFSTVQGISTDPDQASAAPIILNFTNQNPSQDVQQVNNPVAMNPEEEVVIPGVFKSPGRNNVNSDEVMMQRTQPTRKKRIRPPSQTYDHIIAERKRREQLSQLFVALSALVPGLKKMDKGSILEDAIKHLKHLQERVKMLEEKAERKAVESVVMVKKSQIVVEDEGSCDEQGGSFDEQPLPEIEARACDNQVFIRVHCEKHKDVLFNLICKVESLNMIVISTNATTFGGVALDITIVAEMEKEFNMTVKEVVAALQATLQPAA